MIFSRKWFPRKLDRIVLTSVGNINVRMSLSRKSWFSLMENFFFILFEKYRCVWMYLISSHKLESISSSISTFKCSSLLEEIDVSKFMRQEANDPVSIRTRVCRPLIQSQSFHNIQLFLKCLLNIITTKINPVKGICLWTRNIRNYKNPLLSNHRGLEIYEIHWERGCTLEYCNTLLALKN